MMDERIKDKLDNGDKALSGMPYLYRSKGLPSEVYDVRMKKEVNGEILNLAIEDTLQRYPYFGVRVEEREGDFFAVKNENPLVAVNTEGFIPLGGHSNNYHLMENLALDTYLISYIGRFDMPEELVDEVHLYSNCSSGLVLNMTCTSGNFIIDLTQDFETDKYINALKDQFGKAGINTVVSEEIVFETPFDELSEVITSAADTGEQIKGWFEKAKAAAKASAEAAKERAEAAKNMGPQVTALYYDAATGTMKEFDPTKNTQEEMQKLVQNTPSVFIS